MRYSHPSPSTRHGHENVWQFLDKHRLLLGGEHEISIALALGTKRGKYLAAHTEIGAPHVRTLFDAF